MNHADHLLMAATLLSDVTLGALSLEDLCSLASIAIWRLTKARHGSC